MSWSGPVTVDRVVVVTARALCGNPTFEVRGTACRYMVRDLDGAAEDCAVVERDDLRTLLPAMRPVSIDVQCEPDEHEDLAAFVAEIRSRVGARLHLVAPAKIAAAGGGRRAGSITVTAKKH